MKAVTPRILVVLSLLVLSNPLRADEVVLEQSQIVSEEASTTNVVIDSRPLSEETKQFMEETRQQEFEASTQGMNNDAPLLGMPIIPIHTQNILCGIAAGANTANYQRLLSSEVPQATAATYSPLLYHYINNVGPNFVKLEDGSEWSFADYDTYIVRTWAIGDTVVLSANTGIFGRSGYRFYLTNKSTGAYLYVNPSIGPVEYGPYSTWIAGLDYNGGQVVLVNGQGQRTTFLMHSSDYYLYKDWKINDHVILGSNDSWFWWLSSYDHFILNVDMNHYVRAVQN